MVKKILKNKILFYGLILFLFLFFGYILLSQNSIKRKVISLLPSGVAVMLYEQKADFKKNVLNIENALSMQNSRPKSGKLGHYQYDDYFKNVDIPRVDLHVSDITYRKIAMYREESLLYKRVMYKNWYKADMYYDVDGMKGKAKVKIRLKGDYADHLEDPYKWSMRINMRGEKRFLGAKRFSFNGVFVRGGAIQYALTAEKMRLGILSPRVVPVRFSINGSDRGIMYFQEHFSKELVEFANRRESAILSFDDAERLNYAIKTGYFHRDYDRPINVPIGVYQYKKDMDNSVFWHQYNAHSIMQSYIEGLSSASDVIDIDSISRAYALLMIWEGSHSLHLNNVRWYYNPILRKFERIIYDESIDGYNPDSVSIFIRDLLSNFEFLQAVYAQLEILESFYKTAEFQQKYKKDMDYMMFLSKGDKMLYDTGKQDCEHFEMVKVSIAKVCDGTSKWLLDNAKKSKAYIKDYMQGNIHQFHSYYKKITPDECDILNKKAQAYWVLKGRKSYVRILNISCEDIVASQVSYHNLKSNTRQDKSINIPIKPDLEDFISSGVLVPVPEFGKWNDKNTKLTVTYKDGNDNIKIIDVNLGAIPKAVEKLPSVVSLWQNLNGVNIAQNTIVIDQDANITIDRDVYLPKTHKLQINAGANINIIDGGLLRTEGKVQFNGQPDKKIVISVESGYDDDNRSLWGGMLFMNETTINYSLFTGNTIAFKNRQDVRGLTSCITAYKAKITIENTIFKNLQCEDALNVVSGEIYMNNSSIYGSSADGLDSDFSTGIIKNSTFANIGNDALDFSGSVVNLDNITANRIGDKGISAGESSTIDAKNITINGAEYAVASKDNSVVTLSNLDVSKIRLTVFGAYIKKAEYGVGKIFAHNVVNNDNNPLSECQTGSVIKIDDALQACYQERTDILPVQIPAKTEN